MIYVYNRLFTEIFTQLPAKVASKQAQHYSSDSLNTCTCSSQPVSLKRHSTRLFYFLLFDTNYIIHSKGVMEFQQIAWQPQMAC